MKITRVGMDIAKGVFQAVAVGERSQLVWKRRWRRAQVLTELAKLEPTLVVMEACGSAHYWAREITKLGHRVWLLPPQQVRAYRQGQKDDTNDAFAIVEASYRADLHPVAIKSEEQQELQLLYRVRYRLIRARTALANQTRGALAEFGVVMRCGLRVLRRQLPGLIESLRPALGALMAQQYEELVALDARIATVTKQLERCAAQHEGCRRLMELPGVGPITAVLLVAHCCPQAYRNGRTYAAVLGLVPRHDNSADRIRLSRITKRGQTDLRTLLIHGGRSVVKYAARHEDPLSCWARAVAARRGKNRAAVAVANKLARYAWAELKRSA